MWRLIRLSRKDDCTRYRGMLCGYMDRRLDPEELAQVEEHLRTCQACHEELELLRATATLLHRLPELAPSRSFTLAPVAPVARRRAVQAMRFATAGATVMLVVAMAAWWTDMFQQNPFSNQELGSSSTRFGPAKVSEEGESYWVVEGVKNDLNDQSETPVDLVVPDGSDNVHATVTSLFQANDGVLYAEPVYGSDDVPQLALTETGEGAGSRGDAVTYTLVYGAEAGQGHFAVNGGETEPDYYSCTLGAASLNMVSADNTELYSFDLRLAKKEFKSTQNHHWLGYVVYSLMGLVMVLAGATLALWLRQRRRKTAGVS